MTHPMVEKIARAIQSEAAEQEVWHFDGLARAVLTALLEPDEQMVEAMFKRWRSGPDYTVRDAQRSCFTAAIRSLLEEK